MFHMIPNPFCIHRNSQSGAFVGHHPKAMKWCQHNNTFNNKSQCPGLTSGWADCQVDKQTIRRSCQRSRPPKKTRRRAKFKEQNTDGQNRPFPVQNIITHWKKTNETNICEICNGEQICFVTFFWKSTKHLSVRQRNRNASKSTPKTRIALSKTRCE